MHLKNLIVSHNSLTAIHKRALMSNSNLEHLDLSNNDIYFNESTQPNWTSMNRLKHLNLAHNNISVNEIPHQWKHGWLWMKTLNMSYNNVGPNINLLQLKFEQKEITVDFSHNKIEKIEYSKELFNKVDVSPSLSDKRIINITNNPIVCDCDSLYLAQMKHENLNSSAQQWFRLTKDPITCSQPKQLQGKNIADVPFEKFSCMTNHVTPEQ